MEEAIAEAGWGGGAGRLWRLVVLDAAPEAVDTEAWPGACAPRAC
jgi:hypothetical protein